MAKTRVTPLKSVSIPRLELQAAVMASRLSNYISAEHEIKINRTCLWTDSKTVLCWIRADTFKYKQFVAHRIGEIRENTNVNDWRWVPTKENVADEATKWTRVPQFENHHRWYTGPEFLLLPKDQWPKEKKNNPPPMDMNTEFLALTVTRDLEFSLPPVDKFSKLTKLIRSTAWILHFANNCKKSIRQEMGENTLTKAELTKAEILLWRHSQWVSFKNEVSILINKKDIDKSSKIFKFSPFLCSSGVLRLGGRIGNDSSVIDNETKYPVILDSKNDFTKLLIQFYHEKFNHRGQEIIINEIKQKFFILRLRSAVKYTFFNCQFCKNFRTKPEVPRMGLLPEARLLSYQRPFTYTGVDYFGPMEVNIGRRREKRYGVLFTCLTTRAIHLEIAASLSTDSTIMAIRRMAARRGNPSKMWSDNGTNLRGAAIELEKALKNLDQTKINGDLLSRGIEWHFIPPVSPNMGGSWERLIRCVKTTLKIVLKERAPKEECLQTLIAEIENIVNSRPLTFVSTDPHDPESLTPNHFIFGTSSTITNELTPGKIFSFDEPHENILHLTRQWKIAQRLADNFWKRFVKEYIPTLITRTKWHAQNKNINVGDVVIIADSNLPRNVWLKGLVTKVYPGKDNTVRVVDVKTETGILKRPVNKLCKIIGNQKDSDD